MFQYIDSILEDLLPDDVRHLIAYEDELTQIGSYVYLCILLTVDFMKLGL